MNKLMILFILTAWSCTFDYGESKSSSSDLPDLVMENVEYVRIRAAYPLARIQADRVERYEKQSLMTLQNFVFEQYGERGNKVNVLGRAGYATLEIDTGDIFMDMGVKFEVEAEDIILETNYVEWRDESRTIFSGVNDEVYIYRKNGTRFTGTGLRADTRRRTWEFTNTVRGTYIHDDNETKEN